MVDVVVIAADLVLVQRSHAFLRLEVDDEAKQGNLRSEDHRIKPSSSIERIDSNKSKASKPCRKQKRIMGQGQEFAGGE